METLVWWLSQEEESLGLKKNHPKRLPPSNSSSNVGASHFCKNTNFLWGGHPARPLPIAGETPAPQDVFLHNWDAPSNVAKSSEINCYIVFLPGVGSYDADNLTDREAGFLDRLLQAHPNCVAVRDVFPYSEANEGLVGERLLAPLWNFARQSEGIAYTLINIRNIWRLAISIDDRYGQIYNQGIANAIVERMNAAHPISFSQRQPIKLIVMSTSGGAQVALGAVPP